MSMQVRKAFPTQHGLGPCADAHVAMQLGILHMHYSSTDAATAARMLANAGRTTEHVFRKFRRFSGHLDLSIVYTEADANV